MWEISNSKKKRGGGGSPASSHDGVNRSELFYHLKLEKLDKVHETWFKAHGP